MNTTDGMACRVMLSYAWLNRAALAIVVITILAVATSTSCTPHETPARENVVRDSAGITIVESSTPVWTPASAWYVDTTDFQVIGGSDVIERNPLDPVSVFRTAAGEIVIADGNQAGWHKLLIHDAHGKWVRSLGSTGKGPCEFSQVWWAAPYRGDSVAVFDMGRHLVHILSLDGACGGSVNVPRQLERTNQRRRSFINEAYAVYPDGSILMAPMGWLDTEDAGPTSYRHELIRVDRNGEVRARLGEFEIGSVYWDGRGAHTLFYGPFGSRALDGYELLYGTGRSYELQRFDSTGRLIQIIRRPVEPEPVTRRDQERAVTRVYVGGGGERRGGTGHPRSVAQRIDDSKWAEYKPSYRSFRIDSRDHIWVEDYRLESTEFQVAGATPATWSVFSPRGEWLGPLTVPSPFHIKSIYDEEVFGIWQNEDGTRSVRAYPLRKPRPVDGES